MAVISGTAATPTPTSATQAANPNLSVGSYVNQQLGALSSGLGSATGPVNQGSTASPGVAQHSTIGTQANQMYSDMQSDNTRQMGMIQIQNQIKQRQLAAAKAAQAAAAAAAAQASTVSVTTTNSGGGGGGGGGNPGNAYQKNGSLSNARNQALATASSYLGDRYVLGGTSHNGIDCSGLVMEVYDQFGYGRYLDSHLAGHQAQAIPGVRTSISNLRPGDLVCWNDGSHIAIYAGNGQIIEAANERVGTVKRNLWSSDVFGIALRLPGE